MPETLDNETDESNKPDESAVIRDLRKKADKADAAEQRAVAAERKLAVSEAGLTLNDAQRTALAAVHQGEWNPESVKATAESLGFVKVETEQKQTPDPPPAGEGDMTVAQYVRQAQEAMDEAMAGTPPPRISDDDAFAQRIREAKSPEEVLKIASEAGLKVS